VSQRPAVDYLHLVEGPTDHDTPQQPHADSGDTSKPPRSAVDGPA
jgi:hypothetical protein